MTSFNLRSILSRGKGVFSEFMAKNVILNDISPKLLNILEDDEDIEEVDKVKEEKLGDDLKVILKDEKCQEFYGR